MRIQNFMMSVLLLIAILYGLGAEAAGGRQSNVLHAADEGQSSSPSDPAISAEVERALATSAPLRRALRSWRIRWHLGMWDRFARLNGDTRASGTFGYDDSRDYVVEKLTEAGYEVTVQSFTFQGFVSLAPPKLTLVTPGGEADIAYRDGPDFGLLFYSGTGIITGTVQAIDVIDPATAPRNSSTSGCEAADFADFAAGNIALLQRGTCPFGTKATNARAAGAVGVVIFNEGQASRRDTLIGSLGGDVDSAMPTFGASYALGKSLLDRIAAGERVTLRMEANTRSGQIDTYNVLAETPGGNPDAVVMAGAHLDSVASGPGINDNGSGSATVLEMALQLAELGIEPINKVRFAFWGAEELGLFGSFHYVGNLPASEREKIALYLNFDMIGSPNYYRGVYSLPRLAASEEITQVFADYFDAQGLYWEPVNIGARSDHAAFLSARIASGGLFTGAEGIMLAEQAENYPHAQVGVAFDPCYHQRCDRLTNISMQALDEMGDAAAHALMVFAMDEDVMR